MTLASPSRIHLADAHFPLSPLNSPPLVADRHDGVLGHDLSRQRVAIVAAGLGRELAPLDDPDWAVWALNLIPPLDRHGRLRCDLWWDIHQRSAQSADDLRWIAACPVPIMVPPDLLDAGPGCVRYPVERVEMEVAAGPFACTFAYQIAYALLVGYREIGLFGVELAYGTDRERTVEYASVSWWMGFARARGAKLHVPSGFSDGRNGERFDSLLGQHPARYGLEYDAEKRAVDAYLRRSGQRVPIDGPSPSEAPLPAAFLR